MTEEQMARWHEQMVDPGRGTDLFTIIYDEKDLPIDEISFHRLDRDAMQADVNIKVRADRRGRGYGNEAMRLFLDYFFLKLGGERMTDDLALENVAGQRTLENFGFRHNPELKNAYRLELIREDYLNRQEN